MLPSTQIPTSEKVVRPPGRSQIAVHHKGIHVAKFRMVKHCGKPPHNAESHALPQTDGAYVAADAHPAAGPWKITSISISDHGGVHYCAPPDSRDATTPIPPDIRGDYGELLDSPKGTDVWLKKLEALTKELQK